MTSIRRLLVVLVVLGALLVGVDRIAAFAAGQMAAQRVAEQFDEVGDSSVDFRGFPFLTQLLDREADRVDVSLRDVRLGEMTVGRVDADLHGVRLVGGNEVRVGELGGDGFVSYAALAAAAEDAVDVSYGGEDLVRVTRSIGSFSVSALGRAAVRGGAVVVRPIRIETSSGSITSIGLPLSSFAIRIPLRDVPDGVEIDLQPNEDGIEMRFTGADVVVRK